MYVHEVNLILSVTADLSSSLGSALFHAIKALG